MEDKTKEIKNENEYLIEVNELKKRFEEKDKDIKNLIYENKFLKNEIVKMYGSISLLNESSENAKEGVTFASLFLYLGLVHNRLNYLYKNIINEQNESEEESDDDDNF